MKILNIKRNKIITVSDENGKKMIRKGFAKSVDKKSTSK